MNWVVESYPSIVTSIGLFDATIILAMGCITAFLYMFDNFKASLFWDRIWPAMWVLIATSFGAGIVFTITRFLALWISK
jgi:hypothetical protein